MSFKHFGLSDPIIRAIDRMGYIDPSPIQEQAIPIIFQKKDLVASAQTGTGKTAAFALPILHSILDQKNVNNKECHIKALIIEPTRELALQVAEALKNFAHFIDIRQAVIFGGVGYGKQELSLRSNPDIIIATPGRLIDFLEQGIINLNHLKFFVLDEFDRMLDMGFLPEIKKVIHQLPQNRQTLLFSATLPHQFEKQTAWFMNQPDQIVIGGVRSPAENVSHWLYPVASDQKLDLLKALLDGKQSVIVFCRTKNRADKIAYELKKMQYRVALIHSNRSQRERLEALSGFKSGKHDIMIATDIVARGIDVQAVSHVINYDVPENPEDYVHRIGRTGRADALGKAFTLITTEDIQFVKSIEKFINRTIPYEKLVDFPYLFTTLLQHSDSSTSSVQGSRTSRGYSYSFRRKKY